MNGKLKDIVVNPKNMLITELDDYYGSASDGSKWNGHIPENQLYQVGIIEKVGKDLPTEWEGHVVYYPSKIGKEVNLKGIGIYLDMQDALKILVRMDQDINNYKQ